MKQIILAVLLGLSSDLAFAQEAKYYQEGLDDSFNSIKDFFGYFDKGKKQASYTGFHIQGVMGAIREVRGDLWAFRKKHPKDSSLPKYTKKYNDTLDTAFSKASSFLKKNKARIMTKDKEGFLRTLLYVHSAMEPDRPKKLNAFLKSISCQYKPGQDIVCK